jgi:hypothetical protein
MDLQRTHSALFGQGIEGAIENHAAPQHAAVRNNVEQCGAMKAGHAGAFPSFRSAPRAQAAQGKNVDRWVLPAIDTHFSSFILTSKPIRTATSRATLAGTRAD